MSRNREIPQRVIVADQVNGSAVNIVASENYFDSVTPEGRWRPKALWRWDILILR